MSGYRGSLAPYWLVEEIYFKNARLKDIARKHHIKLPLLQDMMLDHEYFCFGRPAKPGSAMHKLRTGSTK